MLQDSAGKVPAVPNFGAAVVGTQLISAKLGE